MHDEAEHGGEGNDDDGNENVEEHVVWLPPGPRMQPASPQIFMDATNRLYARTDNADVRALL